MEQRRAQGKAKGKAVDGKAEKLKETSPIHTITENGIIKAKERDMAKVHGKEMERETERKTVSLPLKWTNMESGRKNRRKQIGIQTMISQLTAMTKNVDG